MGRTFMWGDTTDGFEVHDGTVYRINCGVEAAFPDNTWSVSQLEHFSESANSTLHETTAKPHAEVHTTRVLLFHGDVIDVEDAERMVKELQAAIREYKNEDVTVSESVNVENTAGAIDYTQRRQGDSPDFPGQLVVSSSWTDPDKHDDGYVRTSFRLVGNTGYGPESRVHVKIRRDNLDSIIGRADRGFSW